MTEIQLIHQEKKTSGTAWTRNEEFEKNGYLKIEDLYNPEELYHPLPAARGTLKYWGDNPDNFINVGDEPQVKGSLARYWHPQYRKVHTNIRKKIEKIIGRKLYNTYYYDRYYFPGQKLGKHTDRDACEISITLNCSSNLPADLKDWPIKIKTPDTYTDKTNSTILVPGEEHSCVLNPGDGMLYKGVERPHWRDPMPIPRRRKRDVILRKSQKEYYYHQIFFHYVLQDGQRAHCAWDRAS